VNAGVLIEPCAMGRPLASKMTTPTSQASRTVIEKDVRTNVNKISSAMEIKWSQTMPKVMLSEVLLIIFLLCGRCNQV
jgi:hypothetical protein